MLFKNKPKIPEEGEKTKGKSLPEKDTKIKEELLGSFFKRKNSGPTNLDPETILPPTDEAGVSKQESVSQLTNPVKNNVDNQRANRGQRRNA